MGVASLRPYQGTAVIGHRCHASAIVHDKNVLARAATERREKRKRIEKPATERARRCLIFVGREKRNGKRKAGPERKKDATERNAGCLIRREEREKGDSERS